MRLLLIAPLLLRSHGLRARADGITIFENDLEEDAKPALFADAEVAPSTVGYSPAEEHDDGGQLRSKQNKRKQKKSKKRNKKEGKGSKDMARDSGDGDLATDAPTDAPTDVPTHLPTKGSTFSPTSSSNDPTTTPSTIMATIAPTSIPLGSIYYKGFEQGTFPDFPQWTTTNEDNADLVWELTTQKANSGVYSIKSPNLESEGGNLAASSKATFITDADSLAGELHFSVLASVMMPFDNFEIMVDGAVRDRDELITEFEDRVFVLGPGQHTIDFVYTYNPLSITELPPSTVFPDRIGAVFIDDIYFVPFNDPNPTLSPSHSPVAAHLPSISPSASEPVTASPTITTTDAPTPADGAGTSSPTDLPSISPSASEPATTVAPTIEEVASESPSISPSEPSTSITEPTTIAPTSVPDGAIYYKGFEQGNFPFVLESGDPEWTTSNSDNPALIWELTSEESNSGTYSLKSPVLENADLTSASANLTLTTDLDWPTGNLTFSIIPSVQMPLDLIEWYVDGALSGATSTAGTDFVEEVIIDVGGDGVAHKIDFVYSYNPNGLSSLPPANIFADRSGSVYIDDVYFTPGVDTLAPTPADVGGTTAPTVAPSTTTTSAPPVGCVPLDPNPDSFEEGTFPLSPWSTAGDDGVWALTTEKAFNGTTSLRSPDLEDTPQQSVSNATLQLCDDFGGGALQMQVYASVAPPRDIFIIYKDGEIAGQLVDVNEWVLFDLVLEPGPHIIDFSYRYNEFGLNLAALPPSPSNREGAVWIDMVAIDGV